MPRLLDTGTICRAEKRACPLGLADSEHIEADTPEYLEKKLEEIHGVVLIVESVPGLRSLGVFSGDKIDSYIHGDCVYFANAIVNKNPEKYELMLVSDFAEEDLEECWYHAAAFEINREKIVDAHGGWENWDAFSKFLEEEGGSTASRRTL